MKTKSYFFITLAMFGIMAQADQMHTIKKKEMVIEGRIARFEITERPHETTVHIPERDLQIKETGTLIEVRSISTLPEVTEKVIWNRIYPDPAGIRIPTTVWQADLIADASGTGLWFVVSSGTQGFHIYRVDPHNSAKPVPGVRLVPDLSAGPGPTRSDLVLPPRELTHLILTTRNLSIAEDNGQLVVKFDDLEGRQHYEFRYTLATGDWVRNARPLANAERNPK